MTWLYKLQYLINNFLDIGFVECAKRPKLFLVGGSEREVVCVE